MRRSTPTKQNLLTSGEKDEQLRRMMLFRALSTSILTTRQASGGTQMFSGLRDVYTALGYPLLSQIKFIDYWTRYKRQDIAGRIVDAPVEGSWARLPIINSEDDSDKFKDTWEELEERLGIYSTLIRADILSGIGQYGVILLGLNDGSDNFAQPATTAKELLYLQPFHQDNATIKTYDIDRYSARYGQPESYSLQLANLPGMTSQVAIDVHHSRIIHLADNLLESNVLGTPRLEKSFNDLIGLEMVVGSSPEMFWQGAFPGMAFKAQEDFDITPEIKLQLDDEITKYVHQMERYMKLQGLDVQQLSPNIASPKDVSDLLIKMISISTKIPKRILEGSERGELSSTQDAEEWDSRCDLRRKNYVGPCILRRLIKRLGELKILEVPNKYNIEWADLSTPSDADQATTGKTRTEAITKYAATPEAQLIVPAEQFLSDILQLPAEVVDRIIEAGQQAQAQAQAEEAEAEQQRQDDIATLGYDPNDLNDPNNPQNPKNTGGQNA
jgi:uncharacterized protein